MSEQPEGAAGAAGATEPTGDPGGSASGSQGGTEPREGDNQEAARYRRRLRDTEAERDELRGRVQTLQRREVERLAGDALAQGSDVWMFVELGDLLTEEGEVDPDAVSERVAAVARDRPGLARGARVWPDLGQGHREDTPPAASWADVISQR